MITIRVSTWMQVSSDVFLLYLYGISVIREVIRPVLQAKKQQPSIITIQEKTFSDPVEAVFGEYCRMNVQNVTSEASEQN